MSTYSISIPNTVLEQRVHSLETRLARTHALFGLLILLAGSVLLYGAAEPPSRVEASEFVLKDGAQVLGRFAVQHETEGGRAPFPELVMYDMSGTPQVQIQVHSDSSVDGWSPRSSSLHLGVSRGAIHLDSRAREDTASLAMHTGSYDASLACGAPQGSRFNLKGAWGHQVSALASHSESYVSTSSSETATASLHSSQFGPEVVVGGPHLGRIGLYLDPSGFVGPRLSAYYPFDPHTIEYAAINLGAFQSGPALTLLSPPRSEGHIPTPKISVETAPNAAIWSTPPK